MSTERTISATRRVEVKASPASVSATVTAPRTMTLHERFSQLPKAEPKPKKEEKVAAKSVDLNLFQEVGVSTRRAATEQRQSQKREEVVTARRAASSTWTPSFYDDDVSPHVQVNFNDSGLRRENGATHQRNGGAERRRQIEIARPVEPAFIVKGIPPPRAPAKQRIVVPDPRSAPRARGRGSAPRGRAAATATRGGRQAAAVPSKQTKQQAPVRGGRGGPVAARGGRGGAVRGGRGGAAARGGGKAKPKSKDELDAELSSYMLQTPETAKNYLDQQLEDYMHAREQETASSP